MKLLHLLGFDKTDSGWVHPLASYSILYVEDSKNWSVLDFTGTDQFNPEEHIFKSFEEVMVFLEPRLEVEVL